MYKISYKVELPGGTYQYQNRYVSSSDSVSRIVADALRVAGYITIEFCPVEDA